MSASVPLNRIIREHAHQRAAANDDNRPDLTQSQIGLRWRSALVGAFARGDLLDEIDDLAAQLRIGDAGERRVSARPSEVARKSET